MSKVLVSNIQKFCVYDGPGIRTVVFLMGCPLRCKWCQNPENFVDHSILMYNREKCVACGACVIACPQGANTLLLHGDGSGELDFDRTKCVACGKCTKACMYNAREISGKYMTVDEVYNEVMKDEVFFRNTGGGITMSGGECTLHPDFLTELLGKVKEAKISTAIETCGYTSKEVMTRLLDCVDLFLYDIKLVSPALAIRWTGRDNQRILDNLSFLLSQGKRVIIRIPLIPGVNTGDELVRIADYLESLKEIHEIHILPFHQVGSSKYGLSGHTYELEDKNPCSGDESSEAAEYLESRGFHVNVGGWDFQ